MNLFCCILYFYHFFSVSAFLESLIVIEKTGESFETNPTDKITTTMATIRKIGERDIKNFLQKVLKSAMSLNKTNTQHNSNKESIYINNTEENEFLYSEVPKSIGIKLGRHVNNEMTKDDTQQNVTTEEVHTDATEENKIMPLGVQKLVKNRPERYFGANRNISRLCPYFVTGGGFNIEKMASVYWPRFYNLNESLKCFKIGVKKLTDEETKENEKIYGTFDDRVDWKQCHFEIIPQSSVSKRKHFLLGGVTDMGVMRNILITTDENGESTLEEESPDQWMMMKDLVLLRDCITGDVVLFTKSPKNTTRSDVIEVLQELGEEMRGHMVCHKGDRLVRDEHV